MNYILPTVACASCIVTRPACGGCAPVIDSDKAQDALRLVAQLRFHQHPIVINTDAQGELR